MQKAQLELLVQYQDIDLMIKEAKSEAEQVGFAVEGCEALEEAKIGLGKNIQPRNVRAYQRLNSRYKRPIAPVKNETCLGCFSKLPTSYGEQGRHDQAILFCENCGRILYWLE